MGSTFHNGVRYSLFSFAGIRLEKYLSLDKAREAAVRFVGGTGMGVNLRQESRDYDGNWYFPDSVFDQSYTRRPGGGFPVSGPVVQKRA